MPRRYKCISADSHLDIRPERWTPHVPKRWRDRAPRIEILADGAEGMIVENRPPRSPGATAITGIPYSQHGLQKNAFEGPGTGSPEQRVKEQDQDGVDAEILFTHAGYPQLWRGISDDEAYKAVIRAYNEWLAEEYCGCDSNRLIPMGVIPDTGIDDALAEMEYCAKIGLRGINLHRFPSGKSYPTPDDDRFWQAALVGNLPIASHTLGGSTRFGGKGPIFQYASASKGKDERDPVTLLFRFAGDQPMVPLQMAMAGVFDRFPNLSIYWAESQIGWLPYSLEQIDDNYERNRYWGERDFGLKPSAKRPSDYMRENCLWGFMRDPWGVKCRNEIGVDILLWGSDFAHATGNWPHSADVINSTFAGVSSEERYKMLAGNAIKFFHLNPAVDLGAESSVQAKVAG